MQPIKDFRIILIQFIQFKKRKIMWLTLVVIFLFGITACNSRTNSVTLVSTETVQPLNDTSATLPAAEPSIYFPTQEPVDGEREVMEALLFGNLTVVDKCIWVITDDGDVFRFDSGGALLQTVQQAAFDVFVSDTGFAL